MLTRITSLLFLTLTSAAFVPLQVEDDADECRALAQVSRLQRLAFEAKIHPVKLGQALEELKVVMVAEDRKLAAIAAVIRMDLVQFARFFDHDEPMLWSSPRLSKPTAVVLNDNDGVVIYGGLAYRVGSQFGRSGWFIDQINEQGLLMEHRGRDGLEGRGETRWITFKPPYLLPLPVGPEGFSLLADLPFPSLEDLAGLAGQ